MHTRRRVMDATLPPHTPTTPKAGTAAATVATPTVAIAAATPTLATPAPTPGTEPPSLSPRSPVRLRRRTREGGGGSDSESDSFSGSFSFSPAPPPIVEAVSDEDAHRSPPPFSPGQPAYLSRQSTGELSSRPLSRASTSSLTEAIDALSSKPLEQNLLARAVLSRQGTAELVAGEETPSDPLDEFAATIMARAVLSKHDRRAQSPALPLPTAYEEPPTDVARSSSPTPMLVAAEADPGACGSGAAVVYFPMLGAWVRRGAALP